jgi:hypothetical protein
MGLMPLLYTRLGAFLLFGLGLIAWPYVFTGYGSEGIGAFFTFGKLGPDWLLLSILCATAIAWIGPLAASIDRAIDRLGTFTQQRPVHASVLAGILTTAYLIVTALTSHRHLYPAMHDEFSYLIQAHQIAGGHFWKPAHPLASFFDCFQLLVQPVYASAYFPGTAVLYVPGIWLHLPPFVTTLSISGVIAGLIFWITNELVGGVAGWLAILLLLSNIVFRQLSVMTLAQLPLLLYALCATLLWLRWRKRGGLALPSMVGFLLAMAAITRPVDALCFAIPIGFSFLARRSPRTILALICGALPLLCLQLVIDHGITGHWLQTPFNLYADRDYPGTAYGFDPFNPSARPVSDLPQKQMLYQTYSRLIEHHTPANIFYDFYHWRLRLVLSQVMPFPYPLLALLTPVAGLGLTRARAVVLASLPLMLLLYSAYVFFMPHYVMVAAPALILAIVLAAETIAHLSGRYRRFARVSLTLFIAGQAIAALPQLAIPDHDVFGSDLLASVNQQLAALPHRPAVVLFTFDPKRNLDEEPVYNVDVAWPDDAMIIRAHDRGPDNSRLFEYYSKRQPHRAFYRFDEATRRLTLLAPPDTQASH